MSSGAPDRGGETVVSRTPRLARTFSALRYRDFRLLWLGAFTSTTGTWMQTVAQSWVVFSMTGSAFLLGFDGFLATAPMLLFSLIGGVFADRFERRKIMLLSQVLQMTFAFVLALLIFTEHVELWQIFALSFLTGTAQAFSGPAYVSLLPMLVKREDMPNAIAMNSLQFNLARVIGPILAGLALTTLGAAVCFLLNGLSFAAVIVALLMIRVALPAASRVATSLGSQLKEGFRFLGSRPELMQLTLLSLIGTFLGVPVVTLLPVVAKNVFALGAQGYSVLLSAYGAGSVAGALFVASTSHVEKKGRVALLFQLTFAGFLMAFAFSRIFWVSLVMAFGAGACLVGVIALYSSLVQLSTSEAVRGRVMSIFMLAFRGGMPLGNLVAGLVAERYSVATALSINGALLAVVAGGFLLGRARVTRI